jgi:glycerol-3-phosphate acyltransferase PlsY
VSLLLSFVIPYVVGGVPFGYIIGRINGVDVRDHGSGNIGATNVLRVCGKKAGITCLVLDISKGFFPVFLVSQQFPDLAAAPLLAIAGTVTGHCWTPYLGFKGGKGIATSTGAVLAVSPLVIGTAILLWMLLFFTVRYVSLASIVGAVSLPVSALIYNAIPAVDAPLNIPIFILFCLLAAITIFRHRSNIRRLMDGTEPRFERKKKTADEDSSSE